jgi:hypothetical protein
MNEIPDPKIQKRGWSSWSIVRKGQIIGASAGILFTVGTHVFYFLDPPQSYFDLSFALLFLSGRPATFIISKILGKHIDLLIYGLPKFLAITLCVNFLLGFLIGDIIGRLIKLLQNNSQKDKL